MTNELEPVVFKVLAEIQGAQANLLKVQEELTQTAQAAQDSSATMGASLDEVGAALTSAATAAAETGAAVSGSLSDMGASFADAGGAAAGAAADISASLGDVDGSLGDAAGAAADASAGISDALTNVGSDAESAASSIDNASNGIDDNFTEMTSTLQAVTTESAGAESAISGSIVTIGSAAEAAASTVAAAAGEMSAAMTATAVKMAETGAVAEKEGAKVAESGHKGAMGLREMATAFGAFAAFDFLKNSVKDALDANGAMNILDTAITKTVVSAKSMAPEIENVDSHMRQLGFAAVETNTGLAKLTQMTGSAGQAMRLEGLAADLARAKHIDLGAAIRTVGMAATGHVGLLARLGLQTKDAAGHTLSAKAAIDAMAKSFQGTAQAYAGSMAGKMQVFKADMAEARDKVGTALIPVLEKLTPIFVGIADVLAKDVAPALANVGKFYLEHKGLIDALVVAVGAFYLALKVTTAITKGYAFIQGVATGAMKLYKLATGEAALAQEGLDAALTANPIGLVIAAIVALGAVFVYAWKHSETFRNVVTTVWHDVESVTGNAVAAIIDYYIKPLVDAYLWMAEQIVSAVSHSIGSVMSFLGLGNPFADALKAIKGFAAGTDSVLSGMANSAKSWGSQTTDAVTKAHAAVKKVTKDTSPFKGYSTGLSNTVPGAKAHNAALSAAKKHHAMLLAEHKKHLAEMAAATKAKAKEREALLKQQVADAKAAAAAQAAILTQQLSQAQQAFDFARQQLEAQNHAGVQFVNGQLSNVGLSLLNLGYASSLANTAAGGGAGAGAAIINVNVAGSVVTQQGLVAGVQQGLLTLQRTNATLGIKAAS
jgi:phage-related protein